MEPPIGIIAGGGRLPIAAAQGIRAAGRQVACIGLRDCYDPDLPEYCDIFKTAGFTQISRWIRLLRRFGCSETLLIGRVAKVRMYDPFYWMRNIPDLHAGRIWFKILRNDKRSDKLLAVVTDEIYQKGISVIDSTAYIPQLMADEGLMTKTKPSDSQLADIQFALPIIHRMGDLDIGQSIAVKDRDVIAVEAIEGTDAMIQRAGDLCKRGKWTLVKVGRPNQDMRYDVPTVGLQTIEKMKSCGAICLAVESGKTILLDKPEFLTAADKAGIAVIGVRKD